MMGRRFNRAPSRKRPRGRLELVEVTADRLRGEPMGFEYLRSSTGRGGIGGLPDLRLRPRKSIPGRETEEVPNKGLSTAGLQASGSGTCDDTEGSTPRDPTWSRNSGGSVALIASSAGVPDEWRPLDASASGTRAGWSVLRHQGPDYSPANPDRP